MASNVTGAAKAGMYAQLNMLQFGCMHAIQMKACLLSKSILKMLAPSRRHLAAVPVSQALESLWLEAKSAFWLRAAGNMQDENLGGPQGNDAVPMTMRIAWAGLLRALYALWQ